MDGGMVGWLSSYHMAIEFQRRKNNSKQIAFLLGQINSVQRGWPCPIRAIYSSMMSRVVVEDIGAWYILTMKLWLPGKLELSLSLKTWQKHVFQPSSTEKLTQEMVWWKKHEYLPDPENAWEHLLLCHCTSSMGKGGAFYKLGARIQASNSMELLVTLYV